MSEKLLSYAELAERIHQVLGVRPAESTLRAATANRDRPGRGTAVTTGMPAPLAQRDPAGHAQFDPVAVDTWLHRHPQLTIRRHQQELRTGPVSGRATAVAAAREAGLSWQQVAAACAAADGTTYTRQWAQQRYGRRRA